MMQYDDDPAELNADTEMYGQRSVGGPGRGGEASLVVADRLDMIQRNYINKTTNLGQKQRSLLNNSSEAACVSEVLGHTQGEIESMERGSGMVQRVE